MGVCISNPVMKEEIVARFREKIALSTCMKTTYLQFKCNKYFLQAPTLKWFTCEKLAQSSDGLHATIPRPPSQWGPKRLHTLKLDLQRM